MAQILTLWRKDPSISSHIGALTNLYIIYIIQRVNKEFPYINQRVNKEIPDFEVKKP